MQAQPAASQKHRTFVVDQCRGRGEVSVKKSYSAVLWGSASPCTLSQHNASPNIFGRYEIKIRASGGGTPQALNDILAVEAGTA